MVIAAFILGVIGVSGMVAAICLGVYIAYRKPTLEASLPDGQYRVKIVGRNKLTGAVIYDLEQVEGGESDRTLDE